MKFLKTLIAATIGPFLAFLIVFFIAIIALSSTSEEPEPYVQENTVLKIPLSGTLPTQSSSSPLDQILNKNKQKVSLQTLKTNLKKAESDENIRGVWFNISFMSGGWANLQEAHELIETFRDSTDKFVYASTNDIGFNEKGYFLATAADSVFAPPETFFEFDGFYTEVAFYDKLFKKMGIETEITRHGKYKGAVEPFYRQELSKENEYQLTQLVGQTSKTFLNAVHSYSGKSVEQLDSLLNSKPHLTAKFGHQAQLIDSLMYDDEIKELIKGNIDTDESLNTISNSRYAKVSASSAGIKSPSTSNKIAVINAKGPIMPKTGEYAELNDQQFITPDFFEDQLKHIRGNSDVKALVIRISSPGGSGSSSDLIWRKIQEIKKEIPVIVSMGNVAASGGYYIAVAGDTILADPNTITGSIGVFGTKFNTKNLMSDKLGITFDEVKSHKHANWLSQTSGFTSAEQKAFQQYIDTFYQGFLKKVARGRDMDVDQVDKVAQGRVWTGADALEQGLVDKMGGLDDAMNIAAKRAKVDDYEVERFPKSKSLYQVVMGSAGAKAQAMIDKQWPLSSVSKDVKSKLSLLKRRGAMLLFPYNIDIQ